MKTDLTHEQSSALNQSHDQQLLVTDPATNRQYVLIDAERYERFEAVEAIQNGLDQMQRGEGQDLHEAMDDIRKELSRRF